MNLGANTPPESLLHAADLHHPRLAWLSLMATDTPLPKPDDLYDLATQLQQRRAVLVLGGRAVAAVGLRQHHPNLQICSSMVELAGFARGLLA